MWLACAASFSCPLARQQARFYQHDGKGPHTRRMRYAQKAAHLMEWRDEGILLWVRRHGESSAIIEVLTAEHGRHAGLVQGGSKPPKATMLQPGAQLSLEWSARLAEHLGIYKIDLIRARAARIMTDRVALAALNVVSSMIVQFTSEREHNPEIYAATRSLLDAMGDANPFWPVLYARWELELLEAIGYGLDLTRCASTGLREDLIFVSPRTGRAVSRVAGAPFADRMLPLPPFLISRGRPIMGDVRESLRTTGYFLTHWACPAFDIETLPQVRERLLDLLDSYEFPVKLDDEPHYTDEEIEWLDQFGAAPEWSREERSAASSDHD